jgi:hypothetical protein
MRRLFEMPPRESPAGAGFEVALEGDRTSKIGKSDERRQFPRPVFCCVFAFPGIMLADSAMHIYRATNVVAVRSRQRTQHIYEMGGLRHPTLPADVVNDVKKIQSARQGIPDRNGACSDEASLESVPPSFRFAQLRRGLLRFSPYGAKRCRVEMGGIYTNSQ